MNDVVFVQKPLITSKRSEGASRFKKNTGQITALVESEDDIEFWRDVFKRYVPHDLFRKMRFNVNKGGGAKKGMLRGGTKPGTFLLFCLDSDYDYLLQDTTEDSQKINQNPFIFQTYAYSIENYKCWAETLVEMCVKISKHDYDYRVFDFEDFLKKYSKTTYNLFVYSFYLERMNDHTTFTIDDFGKFISFDNTIQIDHNAKVVIDLLRLRISAKINKQMKSTIKPVLRRNIKNELRNLGVSPENTYLFIKGHDIINNVIAVLQKVIEKHCGERRQEIKQTYPSQEIGNSLQAYQNKIQYNITKDGMTAFLLGANNNYHACFLMQKIKNDVENYLQQP